MMDEAGAVEEDVDRPDLTRERLDRLVRADVELALVGVEALRPATSMSVAMTRAPSRAKASAVARPMPAAAAVNNAALPANRPAIWLSSFRSCFRGRPEGRAELLGDIAPPS